MDRKYKFLFVLLIMVLTACSVAEVTDEPIPGETAATDIQDPAEDYPVDYPVETEVEDSTAGYPVETEIQTPETAYPVETETQALDLRGTAELVINALAEKDMAFLADFVHPHRGLRFSPYAFVREEHQVFMPNELPALVSSEEVYTWGAYDGTGDPIDLIFDDYYQEFVYSSDFANPEQIGVNERIGQGNTINNIGEFYPGSSFVEYHFSGFEEQYEGMDWESLRLVFVQEDGSWWLVGIVHDEWTI
jgi:hypothetical protein